MSTWIETAGYVASNPARVGVMIALAQTAQPLDEISLAQMAGLLHQRITGQAIETAFVIKHITDLADQGLLKRDPSGFRWQLTPLGMLISRQWATGALEPEGESPLSTGEIRTWRDSLIQQLEEDADLADEAGISVEELLAGQTARLAELRVLNRVLGEERLPEWIAELAR
jgi:hypothetical protein